MHDKLITDAATAGAALSTVWAIQILTASYQIVMALGALALLFLRLAIAYREWRAKADAMAPPAAPVDRLNVERDRK